MISMAEHTEQENLDSTRGTKEDPFQSDPFFDLLCDRIEEGKVIPVLGSAVFDELLFDVDRLKAIASLSSPYVKHIRESPMSLNIEDELALVWAQGVEYPLPEQHWLPRVAMYDRIIKSTDALHSKGRYLRWLKELLVSQAEESAISDDETITDCRDNSSYSFSDVAYLLGCSDLISKNSPVTVLAKLNLPIYITTSPFDFMERAIIANGRKDVKTQVCFWSGVPADVNDQHVIDRDFRPKPEVPLVYHLFGFEKYPLSMVLNEDDYLDFLMKISIEVNQNNQLVPIRLAGSLAQSSLLLLGYRLRDWEFRVMFRGLLKPALAQSDTFSTAIQIDPCKKCSSEENHANAVKVQNYLKNYFKKAKFEVVWSTPQAYTNALSNRSVTCRA